MVQQRLPLVSKVSCERTRILNEYLGSYLNIDGNLLCTSVLENYHGSAKVTISVDGFMRANKNFE
jgi:hypothetical protein